MEEARMPIPRRRVPDLAVETLDHGRADPAAETSRRDPEFTGRGVGAIGVSRRRENMLLA